MVTDDYSFDGWGKLTSSTGSTANSQLYKGEYLAYRKDPDAGPELQYSTHHRNYNPQTGVFTAADPAKDDLNLCRYVKNNPVNQVDPSGLEMFSFDAGAEAGEVHSMHMAQQAEFQSAIDSWKNTLRGINQHLQSTADAAKEVEQTGVPRDDLIENYSQHIDRLMHEYVKRRDRVLRLLATHYGSGLTSTDYEQYASVALPEYKLRVAMGSDFAIPRSLQQDVNRKISSVGERLETTTEVAEGVDEGLFWMSLGTAGVGIVVNGVRIATTEGGKIIVRKAAKEIGVGAAKVGAGAAVGMAVGAGIDAASDQLGASDQQKAWISVGIDLAAAFILRKRNARTSQDSTRPNRTDDQVDGGEFLDDTSSRRSNPEPSNDQPAAPDSNNKKRPSTTDSADGSVSPSTLSPNPNYDVKPAGGGKFGLFNKDGTPVVEKGQKGQRTFDTQEDAAKWLDLASDPAVGMRRLRADEAATALRVETQEQVNLRRYSPPPGGKGDWVDAKGIVYDGCSPAPSANFAKQWNNFVASLTDHLSKVDKVVVDLTDKGLTPAQVKQVTDHINALPQVEKSQIVLLQ